uniref:uncharacterized protein C9orf85 homolog isoform X2 n=1 Tax=Myxine glutinosa TaxID=7769 RepID=UPI00358F4E43
MKDPKLNSLVHNGVCARCKSQLEWRIKFGKYKLLTQPSTCIKCLQKTVKTSYHKVCHACSIHLGLCAKCGCQGATEIPFASEEGPESIGVEQMQRKEDSSKLHSHSQCKGSVDVTNNEDRTRDSKQMRTKEEEKTDNENQHKDEQRVETQNDPSVTEIDCSVTEDVGRLKL